MEKFTDDAKKRLRPSFKRFSSGDSSMRMRVSKAPKNIFQVNNGCTRIYRNDKTRDMESESL